MTIKDDAAPGEPTVRKPKDQRNYSVRVLNHSKRESRKRKHQLNNGVSEFRGQTVTECLSPKRTVTCYVVAIQNRGFEERIKILTGRDK